MSRLQRGRSWISKHILRRLRRHRHEDQKPMPPPLTSYLQFFESDLSNGLRQLVSAAEAGSAATLSLLWAQEAVIFLINAHRGFQTTFLTNVDYPFEKWGSRLVDEYLADTLNLLGLLNTLSRNLSLLSQQSASLLPDAADPSPETPTKQSLEKWVKFARKPMDDADEIQEVRRELGEDHHLQAVQCEEERIICEEMAGVKIVSLFVTKTLSCCLDGDVESMIGSTSPSAHLWSTGLMNLHMKVCEQMLDRWSKNRHENIAGGVLFQEVVDVNEHITRLLSYFSKNGGNNNLQEEEENEDDQMEVLGCDMREVAALLGRCLNAVEFQIETLFGLVFSARNELLDTIKRRRDGC